MKKKLSVVIMLIFMLALSGCMDMRYGVELAKDGSGKVYVVAAMDKEVLEDPDMASSNPAEGVKNLAEHKGVTVQENYEYKQGDTTYVGARAEASFANLAEINEKRQLLSDPEDEEENNDLDLSKMVTEEKGLITTTWNIKVDTSDFAMDEESKEMLDFINMTFELKLPGKIIEHNADVQNENLLAWDMKNFGPNGKNIEAKVSFYNTGAIAGLIGGGLAVVILLIVFMRRNKQGGAEETAASVADAAAAEVTAAEAGTMETATDSVTMASVSSETEVQLAAGETAAETTPAQSSASETEISADQPDVTPLEEQKTVDTDSTDNN